jgi:hypothetical protein
MVKRDKNGGIIYKDQLEFRPNLTPREIFKLGSFGGTYWRPIHSSVTDKDYTNYHKRYPKSWWINIPDDFLISSNCNFKEVNKYKVNVGTSLQLWEDKGWINESHPYGWINWYCDFHSGKRSSDDTRQIKRWLQLAGQKGRFRKWLINLINKKNSTYDDVTISPKIRQTLQHWGYRLTKDDFLL